VERSLSCVVALVVACGPSVGSDGGGASSDDGSASASEGAGSGTTLVPVPVLEPVPDSCASRPVAGVDPLAGDVSCETYFGTAWPPAPGVEVRIVNRTDETIVVQAVGPASAKYFDIAGSIGGRDVEGAPSDCGLDWNTCNLDTACPLIAVPPPPPLRLVPGGWHAETWSAWVISSVTLPEACSPAGSRDCFAPLPVSAGTYELRAHAMLPAPDSGCECEPDARGACTPSGESCTVEPTLRAVASFDGVCDSVEIALE
jgi:hypothetical protein